MGCCQSDSTDSYATQSTTRKSQTFQGQGQRLGTINETKPLTESATRLKVEENVNLDPTIDDTEREKMRADRAAAAEARAKKQGGTTTKKKTNDNQPLRGPNSRNTMQWNL